MMMLMGTKSKDPSVSSNKDDPEIGSYSGTDSKNYASRSDDSDEEIAKKETAELQRSKQAVFAVIMMAAALCGAATYLYSSIEEENTFMDEFENVAKEVTEIANQQASRLFDAVDSLATTVTSSAMESNADWPEVTIPNFEAKASKVNAMSKVLQVSLAPLTTQDNHESWEMYAVDNQNWIEESLHFADSTGTATQIPENIWRFHQSSTGSPVVQTGPGIQYSPGSYAPLWQQSPAPTNASIINFDVLSHPTLEGTYRSMWEAQVPFLSEFMPLEFLYGSAVVDEFDHPHSSLLYPVYKTLDKDGKDSNSMVGFIVAVLSWDMYFADLLPAGMNGIVIVLKDSCSSSVTYRIDGPRAAYVGPGDLHEVGYTDVGRVAQFAPFVEHEYTEGQCKYMMHVYPTSDFESRYMSKKPILDAVVLVAVFVFVALVFIFYDVFVEKRMNVVIATAKRSNDIVSSLFPSHVRNRLMQDAQERAEQERESKNQRKSFISAAFRSPVKTYLDEGAEDVVHPFGTRPIADLFPDVTVMFADLVGFTAWSSVREPSQVFTLLETVYAAFDEIAERRRVFKVETVGDCYVAAAGLPEKRKDHAVVMARFARDCLAKVNSLTKRLEVSLGPDTGDLSMRIGIHSGPVTAGVLRGEKSRFQLFGDTVNTTARMESTGETNRIQISQETANLLSAAGKSSWFKTRDDKVNAKGKGELQTYWLKTGGRSSNHSVTNQSMSRSSDEGLTGSGNNTSTNNPTVDIGDKLRFGKQQQQLAKHDRLIDWNTEVLSRLLKQIIVRRKATSGRRSSEEEPPTESVELKEGQTVIDEVREIIRLPEYDAEAFRNQEDPDSVELDQTVVHQLRKYVSSIASTYHENPFHNFEHASHVTMSVIKLLSRIVAPTDLLLQADEDIEKFEQSAALTLHDHTYGITSDPLTQFACIFAALIHDADHPGVSNAQLVKEQTPVAIAYNNKSVAEQNSVDLAWKLFMGDDFTELRNTICPTYGEKQRFRQLVVNSVMATDIMDKDLKALRNARWDTAFQESSNLDRDNVNRKATIVIEHLIQASDVSHTMQHWHVYRKWNERLFHEMYRAYKTGRFDKDPSEFWYKGEIGFLDFYIIPLAKKLKDCGVFGVSSDEYLNYAEKNRQEWENKGKEVVAAMIEKYEGMYEEFDEAEEFEEDTDGGEAVEVKAAD